MVCVADSSRAGPGCQEGSTPGSQGAPHSHRLLHNLRVDPGYTIHGMGPDHTKVSHVDSLAVPFLDHRHPPQAVHIPRKQGGHMLRLRTQRMGEG
jgi:hypothetical protein